jgi:C-terminal processing protease CtpA/Prc
VKILCTEISHILQLYAEEEKKLTIVSPHTNDGLRGWTESRVCIPSGKIGIHLKDSESDVSSTIISSVNPNSPLAGKVCEGDCIAYVNGVDVREMDTSSEMMIILFEFTCQH